VRPNSLNLKGTEGIEQTDTLVDTSTFESFWRHVSTLSASARRDRRWWGSKAGKYLATHARVHPGVCKIRPWKEWKRSEMSRLTCGPIRKWHPVSSSLPDMYQWLSSPQRPSTFTDSEDLVQQTMGNSSSQTGNNDVAEQRAEGSSAKDNEWLPGLEWANGALGLGLSRKHTCQPSIVLLRQHGA
jgi:hypothetical protein